METNIISATTKDNGSEISTTTKQVTRKLQQYYQEQAIMSMHTELGAAKQRPRYNILFHQT